MRYTHIKTDGTWRRVTPPNGKKFSLEELQKFVGGLIEEVSLKSGRYLWVNEEGLLMSLPVNRTATKYADDAHPGYGMVIVGDVLLCEPANRDPLLPDKKGGPNSEHADQ